MNLSNVYFLAAAALLTFFIPSEALRSSDAQPALHPSLESHGTVIAWPKSPEVTAFIQDAVQAEIAEQLHSRIMDHLRDNAKELHAEDEKGGSAVLKKLIEAMKPALQGIFAATTRALRPVISDECKRVISVVQGNSADDDEEAGDEEGEASSFVATMQANKGFWDSLKETVKQGIGKIASPAMAAIAEKLAPAFQKLGEKAVPLFRDQVKNLIRSACSDAEQEAGIAG